MTFPHIEVYGKLVHPDGRQERVKVQMTIGSQPFQISYVLVAPDYEDECPHCGRQITFKGTGEYKCPYCHSGGTKGQA